MRNIRLALVFCILTCADYWFKLAILNNFIYTEEVLLGSEKSTEMSQMSQMTRLTRHVFFLSKYLKYYISIS